MVFVSFQFLVFIFLVILIYFVAPKKLQWCVLLVSGYIYYFINSEWLVLVLFGETLVTFWTGILIENQMRAGTESIKNLADPVSKEDKKRIQSETRKKSRQILTAGIFIILAALVILKYYNFFAENLSFITRRFGIIFPRLTLLLPIGISFYSLQAIAYMVDVSRGKIQADRNLLKFMLFMSYFPQIVQGPIPRYKQLADQLYERHDFDFQRFCYGVQLMVWGFMKKMIIADRIAIPVEKLFGGASEYEGMILFFAAALYGVQIYTDFSGGMDIARGVSQILGIDLELNFKQPYFAVSVEDFWRRWHITLGSFMRDYVFYPLSLSKHFADLGKKARNIFGNSIGKKIPAFLAMFFVYFLVGIWHGAEWKYVIYGIWNGIFIAGGILLTEPFAKLRNLLRINENLFSWKLFQIMRTFVIVSFGRFLVRALDLKNAITMIRRLFERWYDYSFLFDGTLHLLGLKTAEWCLLALMILLLVLVDYFHEKGVFIRGWISSQGIVFELLVFIIAVVSVLILGVYGPGYDASSFIYQQF